MVITSKLTNKQYQWIRVPKTATMAYSFLFANRHKLDYRVTHTHYPYGRFSKCSSCKGKELDFDGFTLVRNPMNRFISSLYFIVERKVNKFNPEKTYMMCDICNSYELLDYSGEQNPLDFFEFYKDENTFYDFFYDNFDKNCAPKQGLDFYQIFEVNNISLISSFFRTQIYWAYYPRVNIFKYEEIDKFNDWIETNLGYDTKRVPRINTSKKDELRDIIKVDFTTNKFKKLAKHLFYDDFRYFNYDFPI